MDNILEKVYENFKNTIPDDLKILLKSKRVREEMLTKYGKEAFLDPDLMKFPVINPNTGKLDCRLIYAAYFRSTVFAKRGGTGMATEEYYRAIQAKAMHLYEKQNCYASLKVQLDHETIDILTFTQLFEIDMNFDESEED